jgi:hypothetical protein
MNVFDCGTQKNSSLVGVIPILVAILRLYEFCAFYCVVGRNGHPKVKGIVNYRKSPPYSKTSLITERISLGA